MKKNAVSSIEYTSEPLATDAFLWTHLAPAEAPATVPEDMFRALNNATPVPEDELREPGMFTQWPLEVLVRINKPFTGLVVMIDVSIYRRIVADNENLLQSVTGFIAGLLGEKDFGCRTTGDEFVIICPGLRGPEAQRRLIQISEKLWHFQQLGQGAFSFLFGWGGVDATEKPLSEAVASAVNRMNQINGNRKVNSKESVNHRKTV